jgi:hypothetical protein
MIAKMRKSLRIIAYLFIEKLQISSAFVSSIGTFLLINLILSSPVGLFLIPFIFLSVIVATSFEVEVVAQCLFAVYSRRERRNISKLQHRSPKRRDN